MDGILPINPETRHMLCIYSMEYYFCQTHGYWLQSFTDTRVKIYSPSDVVDVMPTLFNFAFEKYLLRRF